MTTAGRPFNILAVVQAGRLEYEALILAASLRHSAPNFAGKLYLAEPQPGPRWSSDPRISDPAVRGLLADLGAEILPFENRAFGESYPYGNKIEALTALPDAPFLFLDTDTLITGDIGAVPFDFARPSASMRREATWPIIELYGPGYSATWRSLYDRFGLDFESSLDLSQPDEYFKRYLYLNAGWFYHESAHAFGTRFLDYARTIRDDPPRELECQQLYPWLDQIALPLVIHSFGGGRPGPELGGLDGDVTCHYRYLSMIYARENDQAVAALEASCAPREIKQVLKAWEPARRLIYQPQGRKARALFDRSDLPRQDRFFRNTLKKNGFLYR